MKSKMPFLSHDLQVRQAAEEKAGQNFAKFQVISYKTQVVAGVNYFIKV